MVVLGKSDYFLDMQSYTKFFGLILGLLTKFRGLGFKPLTTVVVDRGFGVG